MADQARWFKLWCSAPGDDTIQNLSPALRWAWAAFGAHTKLHGTGGVIIISPTNASLAAQLGVGLSDLIATLGSLPNIYLGTAPVRWPHGHEKNPVCAGEFMRGEYPLSDGGSRCLEEWCRHHGKLTVTWRNWTKYQEDTTQAQRGAASRSKKRREEMRRDEIELTSNAVVRPPVEILSVDQVVTEYGPRPAYAQLDVRQCAFRLHEWCAANGKRMTRRQITNWLNGDARKLAAEGARGKNGHPGAPAASRATINKAWEGKPTGEVKL